MRGGAGRGMGRGEVGRGPGTGKGCVGVRGLGRVRVQVFGLGWRARALHGAGTQARAAPPAPRPTLPSSPCLPGWAHRVICHRCHAAALRRQAPRELVREQHVGQLGAGVSEAAVEARRGRAPQVRPKGGGGGQRRCARSRAGGPECVGPPLLLVASWRSAPMAAPPARPFSGSGAPAAGLTSASPSPRAGQTWAPAAAP
jgi:hypothetical protein